MSLNSDAVQLRSDAQANRTKLLAAAREALAADPGASLNSIAKLANVGVGTLYRHFPTRGALVVAVYRADLEELIDLARALTARVPPVEAFRSWCYELVSMAKRQHGFAETLNAATSLSQRQEAHRPVLVAIAHLLDACKAAGVVPAAVDPQDIQLMLSFIWQIRSDAGEQRARGLVDVVIRGIAAPGVDLGLAPSARD